MRHAEQFRIRFFEDLETDSLATAGGKGANLGRLVQGGFNVPSGFVITAEVYKSSVPMIDASGLDADELEQLERFAAEARRVVSEVELGPQIVDEIMAAYRRLGQPSVAVRSSATAEDLPTASFAGQQESFLHVQGEEALMKAVQGCWASLWTTRAVHYRARMGFDTPNVAMAVIVQTMAPHDVSGVVFTVNSVSGNRDEILINAAPGTGDLLVGGETTPDQWIARRPDGAVLRFTPAQRGTLGSRFLRQPAPSGCLTTAQVRKLAQLALRVEAFFAGVPQDIEWSFGEGEFFVLQSRPVTT